MGVLFKSQGCMERAFLVCIFSFVSISSISFFALYHNYSDIELYLLRKRLSYMSDAEVRALWKVNMGEKDRARDLRRPFQDESQSKHHFAVFQHANPRIQSLKPPGIGSDLRAKVEEKKGEAKIDTSSQEKEDESVYMAPDLMKDSKSLRVKAMAADLGRDSSSKVTIKPVPRTSYTKVLFDDSWFEPTPGVIRILSWTWKYSFKKEWFEKRAGAFISCNMPKNQRCEYTNDRQKYNTSDVILFRLRLLKSLRHMPRYRSTRQKWLVYESESPSYVWPTTQFPLAETPYLKKVFNITSTYSMDSNIPFRGLLRCAANDQMYHELSSVNMTQGKTKLVAWFVSNCQTPSRREDYVRELQNHIPVDIYGECGTLKCDNLNVNKNSNCYDDLLNSTYKFYLAFENSLCQNYVTENLWNLFLRNVNTIPVVLGYDRYTDMVPKGTYIDVRDFTSPQKLAEYLMILDNNDSLFNQYLRRKASLKCISPKEVPFKCKLCEYLHKHKFKRQVVDDVHRYWGEESKCKDPREYYKDIANLTFT